MQLRLAAIGLVSALALAACEGRTPAAEAPAVTAAAEPVAPPKLKIATLEELPAPLPLPYNDKASPEEVAAMIDATFERARASNKRVIVDLGGNWCGWCRSLAGVMQLPEVKPFMDANFEVVHVDVGVTKGQMDRRPEVLKRFGMDKIDGTPWLVVAEPDGTVLHSSYEVTDDDHQTPQAMADWLVQWAPKRGGADA